MNLICGACGATNRVPEERLGDGPVCGRCGEPLVAHKPVALTDASFGAFTQKNELPVLVDFWAPWCGPCVMMAPHFEAAAAQLPEVRLAKLDTEANPLTAQAFRIRSIPTLALFRGGKEVARQAGAMMGGDLQRWVRQTLASTGG